MLLSNTIADVMHQLKKVLYVGNIFHNDRQNKEFPLSGSGAGVQNANAMFLSCEPLKNVVAPLVKVCLLDDVSANTRLTFKRNPLSYRKEPLSYKVCSFYTSKKSAKCL